MTRPVVIGIAGGTGSGKTSIASAIEKEIGEHITIIPQDAYYRSFPDLPYEQRCQINYDHPDAFDTPLLLKHIRSIKNNIPIEVPVYDYHEHLRKIQTIPRNPTRIIIVEGILIFENEDILNELDIRIFVDTDADIRILRRIERDINERGRSLGSIMEQYRETVRPMHIQFVEPTKRLADIIIPEGGHNRIGIDMIIAKIKSILNT